MNITSRAYRKRFRIYTVHQESRQCFKTTPPHGEISAKLSLKLKKHYQELYTPFFAVIAKNMKVKQDALLKVRLVTHQRAVIRGGETRKSEMVDHV